MFTDNHDELSPLKEHIKITGCIFFFFFTTWKTIIYQCQTDMGTQINYGAICDLFFSQKCSEVSIP